MITLVLGTIISVSSRDIRLKADSLSVKGLYAPEFSLSDALKELHGEGVMVRISTYDTPLEAIKTHKDGDSHRKIMGHVICSCSHQSAGEEEWEDKSVKIDDVDIAELLEHHVGKTLYFGVHS